MERLIEKESASASPAEALLIALVAACEPLSVVQEHKRHSLLSVLMRVDTWRVRTLAVRFAAIAVLLLTAGAATAGFVVRRSEVQREALPGGAKARSTVERSGTPRTSLARVLVPAPEASRAEIVDPPALPAVPGVSGLSTARRSESPALVVAAIQALRQDRDPQRAGRLLAAYLRTHPRGALAEEALALAIEAAAARHSPSAVVFARRYLRDYADGRFRQVAQDLLAQEKP
jgi:hypothetical protein